MSWIGFRSQKISYLLLLFGFYMIILSLDQVKSDHTTFCIRLPGSLRYKKGMRSMGMEKFPQSTDLWGHFGERVVGGFAQVHAADTENNQRRQMHSPNNPPFLQLKVYRVKNTLTDAFLDGWFRIELFKKNPTEDLHTLLKVLILYARDDQTRRMNIGEFSLNFPDNNKCPKNDANKYMIISCGGASKSEPLVSNMIVLVRNNTELDGNIFPAGSTGIMPSLKGRHSLNFYIRIPMQACNEKQWIQFTARMILDRRAYETVTDPSKIDDVRFASVYMLIGRYAGVPSYPFTQDIPGGSNALPSPANSRHLECDDVLSQANLPWYSQDISGNNVGSFVQSGTWIDGTPEYHSASYACQGFYFKGRCPHNFVDLRNSYEYKIEIIKNQNVAEENAIPICEHPEDVNLDVGHSYVPPTNFNNRKIEFPRTHEYLKDHDYQCSTVYNNDPLCNVSTIENNIACTSGICSRNIGRTSARKVPSGNRQRVPAVYKLGEEEDYYDSTTYATYTGNDGNRNKDLYKGIGFQGSGFPKLIWGLRKGHASVMALVVFLILPVNLFITRYFKESFMDKRVLYSRIWYQVHIHGTLITTVLLISGIIIAVAAEKYMGTSLTSQALAHRVIGYIAIAIFAFLSISGGFRGFEDPLRKITIFTHWYLGVIFYLLMVVEVTTAVFIPGSGITEADLSTGWQDSTSQEIYRSPALWHVVLWIIIEVVMHVVMMGNLFIFDSQMAIEERRIYFPVLIPVIRENSRTNATGHGLRVIALWVYIFLAVTSTAVYFICNIIGVNLENEGANFGLGPLECTHEYDPEEKILKIRTRFSEECFLN